VSSLPLAIMSDDVVDGLLEGVHQSLVPDGRFLQYQYGLSQKRRLAKRFRTVEVGFTLFNIPPAFVYGCTRQATG
jgi:phospholipid N-methyltransferase